MKVNIRIYFVPFSPFLNTSFFVVCVKCISGSFAVCVALEDALKEEEEEAALLILKEMKKQPAANIQHTIKRIKP